MAASLAPRRRQAKKTRPAETADDTLFVVRQLLITRDADAGEQKIECSREPGANRDSQPACAYCSDRRIASRSGSIPNHR